MYSNIVLVALCALFSVLHVVADCPNSCSGHGTCEKNNKCRCYPDYGDADCSARSCPHGLNYGSGEVEECSGRGTCDQKNGDCKCDAGYEGEDCGRTACPNECSGHGSCVGSGSKGQRACSCDFGYTGADCSGRLCPVGDDPLTTETYEGSGKPQQDEVQEVSVSMTSSGFAIAGDFVLTLTDAYGGVWTTRPIAASSSGTDAKKVEDIVESLPNQAFPDVTVDRTTASSTTNTYRVTFNSPANSGDVAAISCWTSGCNLAGCQPRYQGIAKTKSFSQTTSATTKVVFQGDKPAAASTLTVDTGTNGATVSGKTITFASTNTVGDIFTGASASITVGATTQTFTVTSVDTMAQTIVFDSAITVISTMTSGNLAINYINTAQSAHASGVPPAVTLATKTSETALAAEKKLTIASGVATFSGTGITFDLRTSISVGELAVGTGLVAAADQNVVLRVTAVGEKTLTLVHNSGNTALTDVAEATTGALNQISFYSASNGYTPFTDVAAGDFITFAGTTKNNKQFTVVSVTGDDRTAVLAGNVFTETPSNAASLTATIEAKPASGEVSCSVTEVKKGTKEADVCSGRGSCDSSSGTCSCYSGYTGESCDMQIAGM